MLEPLTEEDKIKSALRKPCLFFLGESRHILMLGEDLQIFTLKFSSASVTRRTVLSQRTAHREVQWTIVALTAASRARQRSLPRIGLPIRAGLERSGPTRPPTLSGCAAPCRKSTPWPGSAPSGSGHCCTARTTCTRSAR